jgi:hypothetical protein
LQDIADGFAAARFTHGPRHQLVRSRIDMVDLDTREALFKKWQDNLSIDLRQGAVKIERAAFLERGFM